MTFLMYNKNCGISGFHPQWHIVWVAISEVQTWYNLRSCNTGHKCDHNCWWPKVVQIHGYSRGLSWFCRGLVVGGRGIVGGHGIVGGGRSDSCRCHESFKVFKPVVEVAMVMGIVDTHRILVIISWNCCGSVAHLLCTIVGGLQYSWQFGGTVFNIPRYIC